ncbi:MAG: S8 family serine peptidase [Armatimonadota bacterium]
MHRWGILIVALVVVGVAMVWRAVALQASQYETKIVVLKAKANLAAVFGNRPAVKRLLMQTAERSQRDLIPQLEAWKQQGEVRRYRRFWIINAIAVEGTQRVFEALERHPAVAAIRPNPVIPLPRPIPSQRITPQQNFTWGLQKIRVPEAWQTFQVQGEGVVVGVIDTGIDPDHPDLRGKIRARNGWFDAVNGRPTPYDDQGHGTHVAGTIAGGNASGIHIGVAPKVTLIIAKALSAEGFGTFEWLTDSMQWMLDPDGDPNTDDGADVVNNSWGGSSDSPTMIPEWRDIINAWIAAKIFPAFAIGNEGPDPRTTGSPGDYPMAFGVGATDINDQIADFSSRGPVFWEGIGDIIKPDVSAPGVDILSSVPGGGYDRWMGTSMACPHVAGTVALMISLAIKNRRYDEIDVDFLKRALEDTAVDLGAPGKDNDYGSGRIDAFEALRKIPPPPIVGYPNFAGSTLEASTTEAVIGDKIDFRIRVVNSGNGDAVNVVVTVPNIPNTLSSVTPLDGGVFDSVNRQIRWFRSSIVAGQSVVLRFQADASSEGVAGIVAQISADNAQTLITNPVSVRIVSPFDPFEPNNTPTSARSLEDRRAYLTEGDEDWFVVNLPAGRSFWIEVRSWQVGSPLDAKLEITDVNRQPLPPDQLLFSAPNYIGRDPIAIVKGNGSDVYLRVVADDNAAVGHRKGSYFVRLREISTDASFLNFGVSALTGENSLRAGEVGIVLGTVKNEGNVKQQILPFKFTSGLRLVQPSQARTFLPPGPRPTDPTVEPGLADWLVFISDPNENILSEFQLTPIPINIGRIWVQDKQGVLFFRAEFVGRALTRVADMDLTLELDTNSDGSADARVRLSATEQALYVGAVRRPLAYLNLTERTVEFGIRWSDFGNPATLQVRAQLRDNVTGTVDNAPDFDWALLRRDDPTTEQDDGFAFGVAPAAGTIVGNGQITVSLIADARTAHLGEYIVTAQIPALSSTLASDKTYELPVSVVAGPPARLTLTLSATEVPSTLEPPQVTATSTVTDSAGNPIKDQTIRFTVAPTTIGTIDGVAVAERTTDENGRAAVTITITGRVGVLTISSEAVGTNLTASRTLTVLLGEPTSLEIATTPSMDEQNNVRVPANGTVVLLANLRDAKGNLIVRPNAPIQFQIGVIPVEGEPKVLTVIDGDARSGPTQLTDEDGAVNGSVKVTIAVGTKAGQMVLTVSSPDAPSLPPRSINVIVQAGIPTRLVFVDSQQESELQSSITNPLVKLVGEELVVFIRVLDAHSNPVPNQIVNLTLRRGFSVQTKTYTTDEKGEARIVLSFTSQDIGNWSFYLIASGIRLPSDWRQNYRVLVLPKLDQVSHERVRGLGLPFLPPTVPSGQNPPSLSEILGVDPQVLQGRVARYNPIFRRFELVDPTAPWTEAGVGLFVKPRQTVNIRPRTGRLPDADTVEISLQPGWNLISFPIAVPVPWQLSILKVKVGISVLPLSQASDIVAPFLWRWDDVAGTYKFVYDRTLAQGDFEDEVKPWESYFAYAFQPCALIVSVPTTARKETVPSKSAQWQLFSLKVQRNGGTDRLLLGLSRNGQTAEAILPPNPVAPTRVALLSSDGAKTGVSVKPERQKVVWTLVLVGGEQDEEVSVSADNLSTLGRDWTLTLVDPTTNTTYSLRTGIRRLRLSAGEERQLQIVAERGVKKPLRVQNLRVIPLRGKVVAIEFNLTDSAQTEVVVQTLTGRTVRVLDKSFRQSGNHRILWDSASSGGQHLPSGIYLVKVIARDEKGNISQSVVSVKLR